MAELDELLKDAETKYRTLMEAAEAAVLLFAEGCFVDCNERALEVFGCTREHLLGKHPSQFSPIQQPDGSVSEQAVREHLTRTYASGSQVFEWEHCRADGTSFPAEVSLSRMDLGGKPYIQAVIRDISWRKRAEKRLKTERANIAAIFEASPVSMLILDQNTNIVMANSAALRLCGGLEAEVLMHHPGDALRCVHSAKDLRGCGYSDACPLCPVRNGIERTIANGNSIRGAELPMLLVRNGTPVTVWLEFGAETMTLDGHLHLCVAFSDITARKEAELVIKDNEDKFRYIFNNSPIGKAITSTSGKIQANSTMFKMLGYTADEFADIKWQDITHPEDMDVTQSELDALVLRKKDVLRYEKRYIKKDGSSMWAEVHSSIRRDENNTPLYFMTSIIDINDRKLAEEALQESESRFKSLFEYAGLGIGYYSPDGVVISYNKKALEDMGDKPRDVIGKSVFEIFPKEDAALFLSHIKASAASSEQMKYENVFTAPTGTQWFSSTLSRVIDENGKVSGVLIISSDITEQRRATEALKQSEERYQVLFNEMNHPFALHEIICDDTGKPIDYRFLAINPKFEQMTGLRAEDVVGQTIMTLMPQTEYWWIEFYGNVALTGIPAKLENYSVELDKYLQVDTYSPAPHQFACTFNDVTAERLAEREIKRQAEDISKQNALLTALFKVLPVGISMVDAASMKPFITNEIACTLLGFTVTPGATEYEFPPGYAYYKSGTNEPYPPEELPITLGISGISSHVDDMEVSYPDGSRRLLEAFGTPVNDENGKPWASLVTVMDITERKQNEKELIYLSYHDQLTGLKNRRFFEEEIKRKDKKSNLPLSLIMIDVNGLKIINDSFGHEMGDELLRKAANAITRSCRPADIVARLGGDEFAVILTNTNAKEAAYVALTIKEAAANEKVSNIELSLSYGHDTKSREDQAVAELLANAENYMYRHKLYDRSSKRNKTIDVIINALFEKSQRESMHSKRVSNVCAEIAAQLRFNADHINQLRVAGLVHDIGKIGIEENILNKPGRLDESEWKEIVKHPESGWRILSSSTEFSELAQFVLNHHERWDGNGYPGGLKGFEIPIEARIIAIADAYDAMTSTRSYRIGMSKDEAKEELLKCAGTQFDPEIVNVFVHDILK